MEDKQLQEIIVLLPFAQMYIYHYLATWFKQIFESNELVEFGPLVSWKELFSEDMAIYAAMASQVSDILLGEQLDINELPASTKKSFELVAPHAEKWADDVMAGDKDLREFIVQTLRVEMVCKMEKENNTKWLQTQRGKKVFEVLKKYGKEVPETPSLASYNSLFEKWKSWYSMASEQGLI